MAEFNFDFLNALLDELFTFEPPLDRPGTHKGPDGRMEGYFPKPEEVREYGRGASLGDGTSKAGLRGLENIQMYVPGAGKAVSLQAFMETAIRKKQPPQTIAGNLKSLLNDGLVTYFQQGREYATRLTLEQNNRLVADSINPDTIPPLKPTLTGGQKFLNFFGLLGFFQPEYKSWYDRQTANYNQYNQTLAVSQVRGSSPHVSRQPAAENGRMLAGDPKTLEALEHASANRQERSRLPEAQRLGSAYEKMLENETDPARTKMLEEKLAPFLADKAKEFQELMDAKVKSPAAQAREQEILSALYPGNRPAGITSLADHRNSKIALQKGNLEVSRMNVGNSMVLNPKMNPAMLSFVSDGIQSALSNGFATDIGIEPKAIFTSKAYTDLFQDRQKTVTQIETNKLLDQFAANLEKNPIPGLAQGGIKNLVNLCIEAHPALRAVAADPNFKSLETSLQAVKNRNHPVAKPAENAKKPEPKQMGPK